MEKLNDQNLFQKKVQKEPKPPSDFVVFWFPPPFFEGEWHPAFKSHTIHPQKQTWFTRKWGPLGISEIPNLVSIISRFQPLVLGGVVLPTHSWTYQPNPGCPGTIGHGGQLVVRSAKGLRHGGYGFRRSRTVDFKGVFVGAGSSAAAAGCEAWNSHG